MKGARRKFSGDSVAFAVVREKIRVELDELHLGAEKIERDSLDRCLRALLAGYKAVYPKD